MNHCNERRKLLLGLSFLNMFVFWYYLYVLYWFLYSYFSEIRFFIGFKKHDIIRVCYIKLYENIILWVSKLFFFFCLSLKTIIYKINRLFDIKTLNGNFFLTCFISRKQLCWIFILFLIFLFLSKNWKYFSMVLINPYAQWLYIERFY